MNIVPKLDRRSLLKGVSLGAGGILLAPLLQKIAAAAEGNVTPPKRVVFIVFDNGFREINGTLPEGVPLESDTLRQIPLKGLKLPLDIEPFAPFQDRLTILHGLRGNNAVDHGGYFAALSGIPGNKHSALGISIDAAIAQSERVEQVFVRHVFRYYLGRNETLADGPTIVAAHKAYRESNGSFKALLASLLSSESFLYRIVPIGGAKK